MTALDMVGQVTISVTSDNNYCQRRKGEDNNISYKYNSILRQGYKVIIYFWSTFSHSFPWTFP
jgi:hypothetical protein